jgi:hypothetical protein
MVGSPRGSPKNFLGGGTQGVWRSQVGDLRQLPVLTRELERPGRHRVMRIGRARVGIAPGARKPALRIWSPVRLLGPAYMAPALRFGWCINTPSHYKDTGALPNSVVVEEGNRSRISP